MSKELKRIVTVTMHRTETREIEVEIEVPLHLEGSELRALLEEEAGDQDFHHNTNNVLGEPNVDIYELEETTLNQFEDAIAGDPDLSDLVDSVIRDLFSKDATGLNNEGYPVQVAFLLKHGITLPQIRADLKHGITMQQLGAD